MMAAELTMPHLIDRLPRVRGRMTANAPLAPQTWFRVGGPAEVLFRPADRDDLAAFLRDCPEDVAITVIGVASNLLVRDGGIPGVTIRLGGSFAAIDVQDGWVVAGAGALDTTVAQAAQDAGRTGLEFLSGIPGTIGGAVFMNAGAYDSTEMRAEGGQVMVADRLISADIMLRDGTIVTMTPDRMGLAYRRSALPQGAIVLSASLRCETGDQAEIDHRMAYLADARAETQPTKSRTGGSTFANPEGHKAWQLIDRAGCRGLTIGGAQVSEKHCNFLLNTGNATAHDIEALGEEVRRRVKETSGIDLRWEIKRIGVPA
jgi:UDP-N-acetylmuramate dehydrogenase